jgi:hypothetical protein
MSHLNRPPLSLSSNRIRPQVYSIKDLYPGQPLEATVLSSDPEKGLVVRVSKRPSCSVWEGGEGSSSSKMLFSTHKPPCPSSHTPIASPHPPLPSTPPPTQVTPTIKALVPALHVSDVGSKKAKSKFKEGQVVEGRVLSVEPDSNKVVLTLKKTLLGSKLPPLADVRQAAPGAKAHGVVTGGWLCIACTRGASSARIAH